jgi:hypothetical protein
MLVFVGGAALLTASTVAAQAVPADDRAALVRQVVSRGERPADLDRLLRIAEDTAAAGLPSAPLTNKIREGLAKDVPLARIEPVVVRIASDLRTADDLLAELMVNVAVADRRRAVARLGESLGGGVTPDEVRTLVGQGQDTDLTRSPDVLAGAARGLAFIKEARLSGAEGTDVVVAAARQGFRHHEIVDLGREVKRREVDYQAGRSTLRALRDAIVRGDRPGQLFADVRPDAAGRPAVARPDVTVERPIRPETPVRPERPERPDVTERPSRPN